MGAPSARTMRVGHSLEGTGLVQALKMAAERGLALDCAILKLLHLYPLSSLKVGEIVRSCPWFLHHFLALFIWY